METLVKINTKKMKEDIKVMAEEQKLLKNQRKTKNIIGERKIPAWEATSKHAINRMKLRIMYAAYGLTRGKSFSQIENHRPEENHPLKYYQFDIDRLIKKYEFQDAE